MSDDPIDRILEKAIGEGMIFSTLKQKVAHVRQRLEQAGFEITPTTGHLLDKGKSVKLHE